MTHDEMCAIKLLVEKAQNTKNIEEVIKLAFESGYEFGFEDSYYINKEQTHEECMEEHAGYDPVDLGRY